MKSKKVLVIGLDGATPGLLFRWAKEGKLPFFAEIMKNGVSGKLRSTIPPASCPAWLSFMTGKNPGKLGIFGFIDQKMGTYDMEVEDFQSVSSESVWEILGKKGKKVGVFNVPTTFPPKEVNGFIVAGWPIPRASTYTFPKDLQSKLDALVGDRSRLRESFERTLMVSTGRQFSEDEYLEGLYRVTEKEFKTTKYLMTNFDWDFFVTVFLGLDLIQHFFWKYADPEHPLYSPEGAEKYGDEILKFYQKMDNIAKELLEAVDDDETSVIIMSDHGFGALHNSFNVNTWLNKKGYLQLKQKGDKSSLKWLLKFLPTREKTRASVIAVAESLGLVGISSFVTEQSSLLHTMLKRIWGLLKAMPSTYPLLDEANVDWSRTKAYNLVGNIGRICINVKGREPQGIVEPGEEYENVRNLLIAELRNLTNPKNGEIMEVEVFKREQVYHGEHLQKAPDLVFSINEFGTEIDSRLGHSAFFNFDMSKSQGHFSGTHRLDGIFIMMGPEVEKGKKIDQAEITDVAPTILYMMGCPIPLDMDGKALVEAFVHSYVKSNPIKYRKVKRKATALEREWSKDEEERIKERLKALGYI